MFMCELKVVAFSYRRDFAQITLLDGRLFLHERESAEMSLLSAKFLLRREFAGSWLICGVFSLHLHSFIMC